jgi:hypothetical protein
LALNRSLKKQYLTRNGYANLMGVNTE